MCVCVCVCVSHQGDAFAGLLSDLRVSLGEGNPKLLTAALSAAQGDDVITAADAVLAAVDIPSVVTYFGTLVCGCVGVCVCVFC